MQTIGRLTSPPRIAIVGCGAVVEQRYIPALRQLGCGPTALIDPSAERRNAIATLCGSCPALSDNAIAVADVFDVAIVATPHSLHEQICVELLSAGKHVFVEKPMAHTEAACVAMNSAAAKSGAKLAVALLCRQITAGQWLRDALQANAFGKLRHFKLDVGFEYDWPLTTDSMWRKQQAGGGVLLDTGAHTIDQIIWWFGEPDEIEYFDDADGGVEANALLRMRWISGFSGEIELSRSRTASNELIIETEKGILKLWIWGNRLEATSEAMTSFWSSKFRKPPYQPMTWTEMVCEQLRQFAVYVRGDPANVVAGEEASRSVALIEHCYAIRKRLEQPWIHYVGTN